MTEPPPRPPCPICGSHAEPCDCREAARLYYLGRHAGPGFLTDHGPRLVRGGNEPEGEQ